MPLISMHEVRNRLTTTIPQQTPYRTSENQKMENIKNFSSLPRENLSYGMTEKRICLYETIAGEKLYMQYPGLESSRAGNRNFPLDARPVLIKADGSYAQDMDFKKIWDIIDLIGQNHRADIDILATIFLRIAYMIDYMHTENGYICETLDIPSGTIVNTQTVRFVWNYLRLDSDVIETLNDRFESFEGISLEGFLYYNDLLAQNEDCKYHYLQGNHWNITTGRINNCLSHLTVISHIRGKIGISKLIDSFQRTGVAPLPQSRFNEACGDLVIRQ
ncbi:Uncharacterised protein [uncultured Clostridium sp.]|nr:Uncharacterised protein [uncultured Clostridium sp.]